MTLFTVTRHGSTFEAKTDNAVTLARLIVTALSHRQGVEIWNGEVKTRERSV